MNFTPLARFQRFVQRVETLALAIAEDLQTRGFKTGGTTGQVPVKSGSGNFAWNWASVAWSTISGKPSTFPPSTHTHTIGGVTGLQTALNGKQGLVVVETFIPVTGATITVVEEVNDVVVNITPATNLANLSITFPVNGRVGQRVYVVTTHAVTTLVMTNALNPVPAFVINDAYSFVRATATRLHRIL